MVCRIKQSKVKVELHGELEVSTSHLRMLDLTTSPGSNA
jgi:hypothetical protein